MWYNYHITTTHLNQSLSVIAVEFMYMCSLDLTEKKIYTFIFKDLITETVVVYENLNTSVKTKEVPKVESMSARKNESKF